MNPKAFYTSKTLWGAAASIAGVLLPAFGVSVPASEITHAFDSLANGITDLLTFGGFVLTVYGRFAATRPVVVKKA